MPIRLRFQLHGNRHDKIFHLVAIDQRVRRDGKPAEMLGILNPRLQLGQEHKTMEWSVDRIKYWLSVGATPSKSVAKYLVMGNIIKPESRLAPKLLPKP
ncbi:37S ribosomal protein S16, mitochondrial [Pleurotus ostreatus]|uniref:Ribosomal protein S16 n=3 Tax=Pleurotus TaxID=5320 RepID=A0A067P4U5_PLEO1|nr:37S ribosomal protein S16, mitochondrial [Pleurotus ostreatus]KAF7436715.1 37S ribosomal protein S16, mitochondrial [Pleurotus ostreatus]KAG9222708.1 hypothetical protein CCMSSC00406_0004622 [Pleurotus cornucopiae]KAJ8702483.1 37S ribosomal protein S16, mitochondrial [Pleurotus ostreatus]KDQ30891.1 hypothetical protein PLEOSDRAFT_1088579 [Pleurotus ostreatus PC15]